MLHLTFLPNFFFLKNLSSLTMTLSVMEAPLVIKIAHFFIFRGRFMVGSDSVWFHVCYILR